jgi:uncharacterized protein with von Willebrand factor type A (vWA) domain
MALPATADELEQAAQALQEGKRDEARLILDQLVVKDPDNAEAWQLLFSVLDDPLEKADCLKQVVRIHPEDEDAKRKLKRYQTGSEYQQAITSRRQADKRRRANELSIQKQKARLKPYLSCLLRTILIIAFFIIAIYLVSR